MAQHGKIVFTSPKQLSPGTDPLCHLFFYTVRCSSTTHGAASLAACVVEAAGAHLDQRAHIALP